METLVEALGGEYVNCLVNDPLMRQIPAAYGIVAHSRRADGHYRSGLGPAASTLLSQEERNPLVTTTYGTGQLIADACTRGCRPRGMGIGGSATNDAGKGMLEALGCRFSRRGGCRTETGRQIAQRPGDNRHQRHEPSRGRLPLHHHLRCRQSPLRSQRGRLHICPTEKGATPHDVVTLDNGLRRFATCVESMLHRDISQTQGAGAAGGVGAACLAFLQATLKPGIETVLETLQFSRLIDGADLVITGEGKIDRQTLMGKAPYGVLLPAREKRYPGRSLGRSGRRPRYPAPGRFRGIFCIQSSAMPLKRALQPHIAAENLKQTTAQIIHLLYPQG